MNKLSRYAHLIELDGNFYLFNVANGYVIALNHILYTLISRYKEDIDQLKSVHPDLYAGLDSCHVIVADDKDEPAAMIEKFEALDCNPSLFGIKINPTLDCNLRCWYCYETHGRGTMMSPDTLAAVKQLITNKTKESDLKHLDVSFFGGEPLLGWDKVVIPVLSFASERCAERGIRLSSHFTTNGVLLTEDKCNELLALGLGNTSFQISIDGNRRLHDSSRVNAAKQPTYDKILSNITLGAERGFNICLRFNYTPDNVDTFLDVLSDIKQLPEQIKKHIRCSFHQIWQTANQSSPNEVIDKADKIADTFHKNGFITGSDRYYTRFVCYGDMRNQVVVNYNGDLYKCTAREFSPETREGVLSPDGNLIWNERYHKRMSVKYSNPVCRECYIMPICNGGCAQNKLERIPTTGCPKNRDQVAKNEYLIMALKKKLFEQRS